MRTLLAVTSMFLALGCDKTIREARLSAPHPSQPIAAQPLLVVVDRVGHLKAEPAPGTATFSFDSDLPSAPGNNFVIEPNAKLSLMRNAALASPHGLQFRVTGTITTSHTLLIEKVAVNPA